MCNSISPGNKRTNIKYFALLVHSGFYLPQWLSSRTNQHWCTLFCELINSTEIIQSDKSPALVLPPVYSSVSRKEVTSQRNMNIKVYLLNS